MGHVRTGVALMRNTSETCFAVNREGDLTGNFKDSRTYWRPSGTAAEPPGSKLLPYAE